MAEIRVSTSALNDMIRLYEKLLMDASKIEVDTGGGGRVPLDDTKRDAILETLKAASEKLVMGCQQGVYGLFIND